MQSSSGATEEERRDNNISLVDALNYVEPKFSVPFERFYCGPVT